MEAGRKLDLLIAEKLFGLCLRDRLTGDETPVTAMQVLANFAEATARVPEYSTDMSAAWEVVEKIRTAIVPDENTDELMEMPFIVREYEGQWQAGWMRTYYQYAYLTEGDTAPHAICLAALKAVKP